MKDFSPFESRRSFPQGEARNFISLMPNVSLHPALLARVKWLDFPKIDIADPRDASKKVRVRIAGSVLSQFYSTRRQTPIWQAWAHLVGTVPPINGAKFILQDNPNLDFGDLLNPVACFRGVKRPWLDEDSGESILIYVLNPKHTLTKAVDMVCVTAPIEAPAGNVLTVLVKPYDALQCVEFGVFGAITKWEFVPSDSEFRSLPDGYKERYAEELWRRTNG